VFEVAKAPGASGRFLLVVALLVVLVGVGSVGGTMAVLSAQERSEQAKEEGGSRGGEVEAVPVAADDAGGAGEAPGDEALVQEKDRAAEGAAAVSEQGALEGEQPDPIPAKGDGSTQAVGDAVR
jgi:hypothetical protein